MKSPRVKSTIVWALVLLNAALLIGFFSRLAPDNSAIAQAARRPGEYAMIPGVVTGGSASVVYIIDTSNAFLTAMTFDQSAGQGRLVSMPKIDLAAIFAKVAADQQSGQPNGRPPRR